MTRNRKSIIALVIIALCALCAVLAGTRHSGTSATRSARTAAVKPHQTPVMERTLSVARCSDASGMFDNTCWTEDKANGAYLSLDYGRYFYVLSTQDVIGPNYSNRRPTESERQELTDARSANPNGACHFEWDTAPKAYEVICK